MALKIDLKNLKEYLVRVLPDIDEQTTIYAEKFKNMIICLEGDLGSGKTMFTKGFAQALGIEENITSPTFNIIKEV